MPVSLTLASLWIIAASAIAMLPMRWQFLLGIPLLVLVVPLLVHVGLDVGWGWAALFFAGLASMFRRPLTGIGRYLVRRMSGRVSE